MKVKISKEKNFTYINNIGLAEIYQAVIGEIAPDDTTISRQNLNPLKFRFGGRVIDTSGTDVIKVSLKIQFVAKSVSVLLVA